jgi:hypothetical protein
MTCRPELFTPLSWERRSSQRGQPGVLTNGFPWRWRRSDSGRIRRPKRWRPRFFDGLRQCSHCLRGSRGRRESWPPSFSLRRPPRRAWIGVREIARRRTSPRRSGGNMCAAWSAWRSLAAILTKAKNTKCHSCNCFFYIAIFRKSCINTSYKTKADLQCITHHLQIVIWETAKACFLNKNMKWKWLKKDSRNCVLASFPQNIYIHCLHLQGLSHKFENEQ